MLALPMQTVDGSAHQVDVDLLRAAVSWLKRMRQSSRMPAHNPLITLVSSIVYFSAMGPDTPNEVSALSVYSDKLP